MDSLLLWLRLGIHRDNLPMLAFGAMGIVVMTITFLAGSNAYMITVARISGSAYILLMLYFVFAKKHEDTSIEY